MSVDNVSARALDIARRRLSLRQLVKDASCISLLWILCLTFFWRIITPFENERMFLASGDFTNQFYPYGSFVSAEIHQGRLPFWNPYILGGHPSIADPLVASLYPIGLLLAGTLGADGFSLIDAEWTTVVHYLLAGTFMYLFVRHLVAASFPALLASAAFTFGGYLTSYPGLQTSILQTVTWMPLVMLFILRGTGGDWRLTDMLAAGGIQALAILGGHPQTAMYIAYSAILYVLYLGFITHQPVRIIALAVACFALSSAAASAALLVPASEFIPWSTRKPFYPDGGLGGFDPGSLPGILLPDWRNERPLYAGILPLTLAFFSYRKEPKNAGFFIGLAITSLILSLGSTTPFFAMAFSLLPGFSLFRDPERVIAITAFSISVLTGLGATALTHKPMASKRASTCRGCVRGIWPALGIGLFSFATFSTDEWRKSAAFSEVKYFGLFNGYQLFTLQYAAALTLIAALVLGKLPKFILSIAAIALTIADLFIANWNNNIVQYEPVIPRDVATAFQHLAERSGTFRIRVESDQILPSNYAEMFGLANVAGDTPIRIKRIQDLLDSANEWRIWQLFNVQYVITRREFTDGVELVNRIGDLNTYRVKYGLPRAYAVTQYAVATDTVEALRMTTASENHPGEMVVLEEQPSFVIPRPGARRPDVEIVEYSPQRLRLETNGEVDSLLVVADAYYPGWKASLDGLPTRIYIANYAFRGIEIPAGHHTVEMVFDPDSFKLGGIISLASWAVILGLLVLNAFRSVGIRGLRNEV